MVWMMLAPPSIGLFRIGQRVIRMPSGIPISTASRMDAPTSQRCSAVSSRTSVRFWIMNCKTFMMGLAIFAYGFEGGTPSG